MPPNCDLSSAAASCVGGGALRTNFGWRVRSRFGRGLASRELRRNSGALLSPTTLLHETFLNISRRAPAEVANKPRFIAYAVSAMRGLIIDCLRRHNSKKKRGSEYEMTDLSAQIPLVTEGGVEIESTWSRM
jgi:hypothetical protein